MTREQRDDFDEGVYLALEESLAKAIDNGLPLKQVSEVAAKALVAALDGVAPNVMESLISGLPVMLKDRRRAQIRFERLVRIYWGRGMDLMHAVIVCAEESGRQFFIRHRSAPDAQVVMVDALGSLHARACRTALEVHRLLSGGFPLGALSRCRTLHEISVISSVIQAHGEEHRDLASRFMLHRHVSSYKDAIQFQEAAGALNQEPFSDVEIAQMRAVRDDLVARFGPRYAGEHGWAASLFGHAPTFRELEALASIAHLRPYYRWASHEIHSDSKGVHMNISERNGRSHLGTGPTLEGLADPAQIAMISLNQSTVNFVLGSSSDTSPKAMLALKSIGLLVDHAMKVLASAEVAISRRATQADMRDARVLVRRGPFRRVRIVRRPTMDGTTPPWPGDPVPRPASNRE